MAWPFSSETETHVGTSVARVVEDNLLPDFLRTAPITAIFQNVDIPGSIMDAIVNSFAMKIERAMPYARDIYFAQLPNHSLYNQSIRVTEVQEVIEAIRNPSTISLRYNKFGALNLHHVGFQLLTDLYGYDDNSNEITTLSAIKGSPVYLENLVGTFIEQPNLTTLATYDTEPNARPIPWTNPEANEPSWEQGINTTIFAHIAWNNGTEREIIDLGLGGFNLTDLYYQVKYSWIDSSSFPPISKNAHFTYKFGEGTYPTLDDEIPVYDAEKDFLPFIPFRQNFQDMSRVAVQNTDQYITSKAYLKKLGIDFDEIAEAIHSDATEVAQVEQAVMLFGVAIDTNNPIGIKYLYHFFDWVYEQNVLINGPDISNDDAAITITPIGQNITFADAQFRMSLGYGRIAQWDQSLVRGEVGDTWSDLTTTTYTTTVRVPGGTLPISRDIKMYVFAKQIDATTVREYRIGNVQITFSIDGIDYNINLEDTSSRILIPINFAIAKNNFTIAERDTLYSLGLHIVFNSLIVRKLEWYETSFFKTLLIVSAIVITVVTFGQGTPAVVGAYAKLTATYGIIVGSVVFALGLYAFNFGVGAIFSLVADRLGGEAAAVLGVIGLALAAFGYYNDMSFAPGLLGASTNLIDASSQQFIIEANEYKAEAEEFLLLAQEKLDDLETLTNEFSKDFDIDPLEIVGLVPLTILGEEPEDFYHRTTHLGNIGTLSLDYAENYVEQFLTLPSFHEAVKGTETDV